MFVELESDKKCTKPLRNILGINNLPRAGHRRALKTDLPRFEALHFKHIRFHDATLDNAPQRLVDISAIFPLFHLDETVEQNYFFSQTDDYMRSIEHSDAEIDFRLGETIDHSGCFRLIGVPADIDKWAQICRHIIGHYKNGEMHGMHLNIKRISVWEEPNNAMLLQGTVEQYAEMFCALYCVIKKDFPDIMVGGPTSTMEGVSFLDRFLGLCKEKGITPDFVSGTYYVRSLKELHQYLAPNLEIMKSYGLTDTPYVLAEWHYGVREWARYEYVREHGFFEPENAAFSVSALIELMDMDQIDVAYYYSWSTHNWALFNCHEGGAPLLPVYYGLLYFQRMITECTERIAITVDEPMPAKLLAGKTADGRTLLLISCHESPCEAIEIAASGCEKAVLKRITMDYREELCTLGEALYPENGVFKFKHTGKSGVYLLEMIQ